MRRLIITVTVLFATTINLYSSDVKLAVFADSLASNCYIELDESNEIFKAYFYIMSDTPLSGANFAIEWDNQYIDLLNFAHYGKLAIGDIESGLSLAFEECQQGPSIPLGIGVFLIKEAMIQTDIQVLQNLGDHGLTVSTCEQGYPIIKARGGRLAINYYQNYDESFWLSKLKQLEFIDKLNKQKETIYGIDDIFDAYIADVIVMGNIIEVTENGSGPFHTHITITIEELLKGERYYERIVEENHITFGLFGGAGYEVPSEPQFLQGQRVIIFLNRDIHEYLVKSYFKDHFEFQEYFTVASKEFVYSIKGPLAENLKYEWKTKNLNSLVNNIRIVKEIIPDRSKPITHLDHLELTLISDLIIKGEVKEVLQKKNETIIKVEVESYIKNKWPNRVPNEITIYLDVGSELRSYPSPPSFIENEKIIAFLMSKDDTPFRNARHFPDMFKPFKNANSKFTINDQNIAHPDKKPYDTMPVLKLVNDVNEIVKRIK